MQREWILPEWFRWTKRAMDVADLDYNFVFVTTTPDNDPGVFEVLNEEIKQGTPVDIVIVPEPRRQQVKYPDTIRAPGWYGWSPDRYQHMADLRNTLLTRVRQRSPEFFLSLDSDILLAPDAIKIAINQIGDYDALGLCCYMSPAIYPPEGTQVHRGYDNASKGDFQGQHIGNRTHWPTYELTHQVDVIMAAKLMKPVAYHVPYKAGFEGEDQGWCQNCKEFGLKLAWCPTAKGKHIMRKSELGKKDFRVGF